MIRLMIVIPSLILIIIQSYGSYIIFKVGQTRKIMEIQVLGISFFFLMSLTFTSLAFEFMKFESAIAVAQFIQLMATFMTVIAIGGFWATIFYLNGSEFKLRYLIIVFLLPLSVGMMALSLELTLSSANDWLLNYDPVGGILLFGFTVNWILLEIGIIYWRGYQRTTRDRQYYLLLFLSQIFAVLSAVVAIFEQTVGNGQSRYYFFINAIGAILFTYAIQQAPMSVVSPDFNLSFLVLSHKKSGVLIHAQSFEDGISDLTDSSGNPLVSDTPDLEEEGENGNSRFFLFSSAMNGILQLINELTSQTRVTRRFSFQNMEIMVEEAREVYVILVTTREYKFLRDLLKSFSVLIDDQFNFGEVVNYDPSFNSEMSTVIEVSFGHFKN
ncbi:MAG: hypothetical protein ACXAE3_13975 [Candidatus Kariarchaeaceae archaeon]|jgi:hypothetical protein